MNGEFSNSKLRRLDLGLLLVFLSLLKHQKAADVATELGLSRSGVSQALGRLRDIFDDKLFLRHSYGLEPTALALALEKPVANAVDILRQALGTAMQFEPGKAQGVIRIGANDVDQAVLIPDLAKHLYSLAPGLRLEILPAGQGQVPGLLRSGAVDLVIAEKGVDDEQLCGQVLFTESWHAICQPGLLSAPATISAECYATTPHIAILSANSNTGVAAGHCIGLTVPGYFAALAVVARLEGIATVPARFAHLMADGFGLAIATAPDAPPPYEVCAYWHNRNARDARLLWVLEQIKVVAKCMG